MTFRWADPGEAGFDHLRGVAGKPVASQVELVDPNTWKKERGALARRRALLDQFAAPGLDEAKLQELVGAIDSLPEDPNAALAAAVDVFAAARSLVRDETTLRRSIEQERRSLKELQDKGEELKERWEEIARAEAALEIREARIAPLRKFLVDFGIPLRPNSEPVVAPGPVSIDEIESCVGPLATPLVRRAAIISTLCAALEGRLLLFDGPVGTGKTTLAENIARACGGSNAVIPVRPAWIEPADLVGYYDPLSRVFRPGPLVEALSAGPLEDRIFATVLDELNLARIENYASDILSRLERVATAAWSNQQSPGIPAWSGAEWHALKTELEILGGLEKGTPDQAHRVEQLRHTLQFPSQLSLPDGIVIMGTLNTDDTTYDLSPKVIDRSFAIAFPRPVFGATERERVPATSALSLAALRAAVLARLDSGSGNPLWERALKVADEVQMAELGVPYSHRVFRDAEVFGAVAAELGTEQQEAEWLFIFSRVLPRIRCFNTAERTASLRQVLEEAGKSAVREDRAWSELTDRLERQLEAGDGAVVRFWRGTSG